MEVGEPGQEGEVTRSDGLKKVTRVAMISYNAVIPMMVGSTPPRQGTTPTWGPPLSYKQALTWVDLVNFLRVIPPQFEH